mmetsp:Transcript_28589/g.72419  ORF Transcript_28589/g.72419 Transcript_28589/m.72419 type:complete len:354 (-) Transcript_28589:452-1513(-)
MCRGHGSQTSKHGGAPTRARTRALRTGTGYGDGRRSRRRGRNCRDHHGHTREATSVWRNNLHGSRTREHLARKARDAAPRGSCRVRAGDGARRHRGRSARLAAKGRRGRGLRQRQPHGPTFGDWLGNHREIARVVQLPRSHNERGRLQRHGAADGRRAQPAILNGKVRVPALQLRDLGLGGLELHLVMQPVLQDPLELLDELRGQAEGALGVVPASWRLGALAGRRSLAQRSEQLRDLLLLPLSASLSSRAALDLWRRCCSMHGREPSSGRGDSGRGLRVVYEGVNRLLVSDHRMGSVDMRLEATQHRRLGDRMRNPGPHAGARGDGRRQWGHDRSSRDGAAGTMEGRSIAQK